MSTVRMEAGSQYPVFFFVPSILMVIMR
jgi:hypothetical protein